MDYYLLLKYCRRQCTLLTPTWAKLLTKFKRKMQDFKRVLDVNCKLKKKNEQFDFLVGFQMLKILFFQMALNICGM